MFKKTWNEINNFKRQKDEDERTNCGALYWLLETNSDSRGSGEMTVQCGNHRSGSSRISSVLSFCSYISLTLDADRTVDLWNRSNLCSLRSLRFWGARSLEIGRGWSRENGEWSIKKKLVYPVLNPSRLRLSFSRFPRTKLQSTHKTGRSKVSICNFQTPLWRLWELKKFQVLCTWNKCRFSYR